MLISFSKLVETFGVNPKGVLHIGAHSAEESESYQKYEVNKVVWIEANPDLIPPLRERLAGLKDNHIFQLLVSDRSGEKVKLNIANNSQASSVLPFSKHADWYQNISMVKEVELESIRLDDFFEQEPEIVRELNFLNMDIQGYELHALRGLGSKLSQFEWVYCEANVAEVYSGCPTLYALDSYLAAQGFKRTATKISKYFWGDVLYSRMKPGWRWDPVSRARSYLEYLAYKAVGYLFYFLHTRGIWSDVRE